MGMKSQKKASQTQLSINDRKIRGKDVVGWARGVVSLGLMAIALLGAGRVVQAGEWKHENLVVNGMSTLSEGANQTSSVQWAPNYFNPTAIGGSPFSIQGYPLGVSGAVESKGTVIDTWTWVRGNPNDNPPPTLTLRTFASGYAVSASSDNAGTRDSAKETASASAAGYGADINDNGWGTEASIPVSFLKTYRVDSNGQVKRTYSLQARATLAGGRYHNGSALQGYIKAAVTYGSARDTRSVSISSDLETKYKFPQPYLAQNTSDNKTYIGFLKRHYTMTEVENPLDFFIGGVARYELSAKKLDGSDIFTNQQYSWSAEGTHQSIYIDPAASGDTLKEQDISVSHPRKHLHLNFGSDWDQVAGANNGYVTEVIRAVATGGNSDLTSAEGQVTVHWYSPKLLELQGSELPDWDPVDQVIDDYILARQQVIEQGAGLTSNAYNMMYGVLPSMIMPDPTAGVLKGISVAGKFLRAGRNSGKFAGLVGIFKPRVVRYMDYDSIKGAQIVKHNTHPTQTAERVVAKLKERGVPKTHAASEFAGKNPQDEVAKDLAGLVEGRAKNIDEAGPVPGTGARTGPQKTSGGTQDFTNPSYRSATRENEAAQTLSDQGYHVEQIPETNGSLDYRINGHEYDCSSPFFDPATSTKTPQKAIEDIMWQNLQDQKINVVGKNRIVLNLDDFGVPVDDVIQHIRSNPNANVQDMFILKNNQVVPFWEFLQ